MTTIEKEGLETKAAARERIRALSRGAVRITARTPPSERYLVSTRQKALF